MHFFCLLLLFLRLLDRYVGLFCWLNTFFAYVYAISKAEE